MALKIEDTEDAEIVAKATNYNFAHPSAREDLITVNSSPGPFVAYRADPGYTYEIIVIRRPAKQEPSK